MISVSKEKKNVSKEKGRKETFIVILSFIVLFEITFLFSIFSYGFYVRTLKSYSEQNEDIPYFLIQLDTISENGNVEIHYTDITQIFYRDYSKFFFECVIYIKEQDVSNRFSIIPLGDQYCNIKDLDWENTKFEIWYPEKSELEAIRNLENRGITIDVSEFKGGVYKLDGSIMFFPIKELKLDYDFFNFNGMIYFLGFNKPSKCHYILYLPNYEESTFYIANREYTHNLDTFILDIDESFYYSVRMRKMNYSTVYSTYIALYSMRMTFVVVWISFCASFRGYIIDFMSKILKFFKNIIKFKNFKD